MRASLDRASSIRGALDPTFGQGGVAETTFDGAWTCAVLQPDGKILVAGSYRINATTSGLVIARCVP